MHVRNGKLTPKEGGEYCETVGDKRDQPQHDTKLEKGERERERERERGRGGEGREGGREGGRVHALQFLIVYYYEIHVQQDRKML